MSNTYCSRFCLPLYSPALEPIPSTTLHGTLLVFTRLVLSSPYSAHPQSLNSNGVFDVGVVVVVVVAVVVVIGLVGCCLLFAVCCLLCVVCCLLFAVCCLLFAVCCLLFVVVVAAAAAAAVDAAAAADSKLCQPL